MFDEIKKSLTNVIAERTVSPLVGTFVLSWSVWNWKFLYMILGSDKTLGVEGRLSIIKDNYSSPLDFYLWPTLATVILIGFFPLISNLSYSIWLQYDIRKKGIRNTAEKKELLSLEDSVKIRLELNETTEKLNKLIREKNTEIEIIKKENEILKKEKEIKSKYKPVNKKLENKPESEKNIKPSDLLEEGSFHTFKDILAISPELASTLSTLFYAFKNRYAYERISGSIKRTHYEYFRVRGIININRLGKIEIGKNGNSLYKEYLDNEIEKEKNSVIL